MDWWNNLQNEWSNFWDFTHGGAPWNGQPERPVPAPAQQSQVPPPAPMPSAWDQMGGEIGRDFSRLGTNAHNNAENVAGAIGQGFSNLGSAFHNIPAPVHAAGAGSPPPFIHTPHGPYYHPAFHPATGTNPHVQNAQTANLNAPTPPPVGAAHGTQIG